MNPAQASRSPLSPATAGCILLLAIAPLGCSDNTKTISLNNPITTAAGGYPLALQLQTSAAPASFLSSVVVILERQGQEFQVPKLTYAFDTLEGGRAYSVTIDNTSHKAVGTNAVRASSGFGHETSVVGVSGKDVWEVLEIAKANGLAAFCSKVPEKDGVILFCLESVDASPVWHITADGTDPQGTLVQLRMNVNADTGEVSGRTFRQSAAPK